MDSIEWMAWTWPTLIFDIIILTLIGAFAVAAVVKPSTPRKGFLPVPTARGDRFYISVIGTALFMILYIALTDMSLAIGLVAALVMWVAPVFKWG